MMFHGVKVDWPLDYNVIRDNSNSNTFGMVRRYPDGSPKPHQGWDFYAPNDTECFAVADARVQMIYVSKDYGNVLVLKILSTDYYVAYCHMGQIIVRTDQRVNRGQCVGYSGSSGNAGNLPPSDQHLHFELRTHPRPGLGLDGRKSPMQLFGVCPLRDAVQK